MSSLLFLSKGRYCIKIRYRVSGPVEAGPFLDAKFGFHGASIGLKTATLFFGKTNPDAVVFSGLNEDKMRQDFFNMFGGSNEACFHLGEV